MLKSIFANAVVTPNDEKALLRADGTTEQWEAIERQINRLVDHPCWIHNFNTTNMVSLRDSMQKNQNAKEAFYMVKLTLQTCIEDGPVANWQGDPVSTP